ncbi:MAG: hypothetical protein QXZ57_07210 [Nitrososphaerota archaeon]
MKKLLKRFWVSEQVGQAEYDIDREAILRVATHFAAPTPSAIGTPAGIHLRDGYSSKIVFAALNTASFWEKTVQPSALDGGEPIDQTTMRNTTWTTKAPQSLKDMGPVQVVCAYDPDYWNQIDTELINVPTTITIQYPDGSTLALYGYLKSAAPNPLQRGQQPEITLVIVPTNWDHVNKVEAGPVLTSVSGT